MRFYASITAFIFVAVMCGCARQGENVAGDYFYKIENRGVQAGYAVLDTQLVVRDGEHLVRLDWRIHYESKVMGANMDTENRTTYLMVPDTRRVRYIQGEASTGPRNIRWEFEVTPNAVRGYSTLAQDSLAMTVPPDATVENPLFFEQIVADFAGQETVGKTYRLVDLLDFDIRDTRYEKQGEELLKLDGRSFNTVVVDRLVEATGSRARMWIDTDTAMLVKMKEQDGNVVTLADPGVVARVRRVNLDKDIFNKTDTAIADVAGITYMKVRATIRPTGMRPTPETLNVPGQKFTGTVEDNLIDGVFEIEHPRYDGDGAPAFPVAQTDPDMAAYVVAAGVYPSDDEVLASKAREITAGAANTWEAATRLAKWVSEEISYAIPGGGTARGTYDTRGGECGGHSVLLATFCRAVGIPARMVWGCMYIPEKGGSFGQHGWTEVYMGEAGWIPLDATAGETDFLDSGHIRVGHYASLVSRLNGQAFEVLDYRVEGTGEESALAAGQRYTPYLGTYRERQSSRDCEVKIMDGGLVVDIPNVTMLAVYDPDDEGRWVCKAAPQVYMKFQRKHEDDTSEVKSLTLHEIHKLPRRADLEDIDNDVPADLLPYLGHYRLVALDADFDVLWSRRGLALKHPRMQGALTLEPEGEGGVWKTRDASYTISFETDVNGDIVSMTLDAATEFRKK